MNSALEEKVIECLDALERGESLEQVLARYAQDVDELRPVLETAVRLKQLPLQPFLAAQNASRQAMLAEAARLRQKPAVYPVWRQLRRWLLPVAALAVVAFFLFNLFQPAVPGDSPSPTPTPTVMVQPAASATPAATESNLDLLPTRTPRPSATNTTYPTYTPEATATMTHTPSPTLTPTAEPTNTPTPSPTASPTPSPSPPSLATDDHGGDDGDDSDDGDSDNSGPGNNNDDDDDDDNSGPGGG